MRQSVDHPQGSIQRHYIDSQTIANNMLGDPTRRIIDIYIPAGHDGSGLPLLVDIVGFTAGGPAHTNWKNFGENAPERLDRLIAEGSMPPVVVAFPDCFTRLGGNQYVNSIAMGNWADFLIQDATPFVENLLSCGGDGRRGIFGKSSGGYGSIVHALLYPNYWSAAACHSGDMGFELIFQPDFPQVLRALAQHGNSIKGFINAFESAKKLKGDDLHILMFLAMAASYDPDPDAYLGIRLPMTTDTCERIEERWANWKAWDPLSLVKAHGTDLSKLKALYIDCGDIDQYNLVYGARILNRELTKLGIKHQYEEFSDNHSSVDYRMDISLPYLAKALSD